MTLSTWSDLKAGMQVRDISGYTGSKAVRTVTANTEVQAPVRMLSFADGVSLIYDTTGTFGGALTWEVIFDPG